MIKDFSQLKKNLKKDFGALSPVKISLISDSSTQLLTQAIIATGYEYGYNIQLQEPGYSQVEMQLLNEESELYRFNPDLVIIFQSSQKLLNRYNKLGMSNGSSFAAAELATIENYYFALTSKISAKIIYYNYPENDDAVFGNYANKTEYSFLFQLRKINYGLMLFANKNPDFHICDLSTIQNTIGRQNFFNPVMYVNAEMVITIDALPKVAAKTLDIVNALKGKIKKCIVLDLDNTVWGGIIGDDGIENIQVGHLGVGKAFSEFQSWVKKLKSRGIIIAVCSKNYDSIAREPFEKHKDMILKLEDISVFVANWENKANNLRDIQKTLNIGFDSMIFIDDNPFERNLVRENIPGIAVPEMPEDPAEYLEYLYSLNLFETVSFSKEDTERARFYIIEAERIATQKQFTNEDDFLKSLSMYSVVESFNKFNTPRVAQLSQRSNQFNLRTVRYTETDIQKMSEQGDYHSFAFTLEDKFGDHGLICVIVMKKENARTYFIENWFMSCRVLKRGMENFALNTLVAYAQKNNIEKIRGEFIPTAKNSLVMDHYKTLSFETKNGLWELPVNGYENRKCFINAK